MKSPILSDPNTNISFSSSETVYYLILWTNSLGKCLDNVETGKVAITWKDGNKWKHFVSGGHSSTQQAEISGAILVLYHWPREPLNLVCDSGYTVYTLLHIDQALLKGSIEPQLLSLFLTLQSLLDKRKHSLFVTHIRSHSGLPGHMAEGNSRADALVILADTFQSAVMSHQFLHQNSEALCKEFNIPQAQAKQIIRECPDCQTLSKVPPTLAINPRGLQAWMIWQTDVTHYPPFGRLKYLHISVDTYSGALHATPLTWESANILELISSRSSAN